jgi:hypothetical protein
MEVNICSNCLHDSECSFRINTPELNRLTCETHEVVLHSFMQPQLKEKPQSVEVKDLCSICDFKNNCALRTEGQFLFQCEDYQ